MKDSYSYEAEIGYMLLPEHWGKGLGSAVARLHIGLHGETLYLDLQH